MKQLDEIINDLYQNNGRKIHQMCDKRLRRFGGLAQKDYDDFYSAANEACTVAMGTYEENKEVLRDIYTEQSSLLSLMKYRSETVTSGEQRDFVFQLICLSEKMKAVLWGIYLQTASTWRRQSLGRK